MREMAADVVTESSASFGKLQAALLLVFMLLFSTTVPRPFHFLASPFLTCCAILPTSFGGKGPHLKR